LNKFQNLDYLSASLLANYLKKREKTEHPEQEEEPHG
jgi:hypothetical protein